jgi:D-glycero-D-manno-heptose 1,7-bisphosphate phosphatase
VDSARALRPALFLDRDGVINRDTGYVHRSDQVQFIDGVFDLARVAADAAWPVVVVTNQAGIGRGLYTEDTFHALTAWIAERFSDAGAPIAATYWCPHHPTQGVGDYRRECADRKPGPGLLLRAQRELGLDMDRSWLVGDKDSDVLAGVTAGVGTNVFLEGAYAALALPPGTRRATRLADVAEWLRAVTVPGGAVEEVAHAVA